MEEFEARLIFKTKHIDWLLFLAPRIRRYLTLSGELVDNCISFSVQEMIDFGLYKDIDEFKRFFSPRDVMDLFVLEFKTDPIPDSESFYQDRLNQLNTKTQSKLIY